METLNKETFSHYPIDYDGVIWSKLSFFNFTRNSILKKDILCFLEEGIIRKYYKENNKEENQDYCVDFFFPGDIFTAKIELGEMPQFIYEPLSKGKLWYIDMEEVRKMFHESQLCRTTQKVFLEEKLREKSYRELQLLKNTPQDRYSFLMKNKPKFIKYIPLKHLASYIGVTPQALSRIRKRIS